MNHYSRTGLFVLTIVMLAFARCATSPNNSINSDDIERKQLESLRESYAQGEFEQCIQTGVPFTTAFPDNADGWEILGAAYVATEQDSLALRSTKRALSLNPRQVGALVNMGVLFDKRSSLDTAKEYYERAIEIDSTFPQAYSQFAANRLQAEDYNGVVQYGEEAVRLADRIGDKAILCIGYHKAGLLKHRDSLVAELELLGYYRLNDIKAIIRQ